MIGRNDGAMAPLHPAKQKALVRELFREHRVVTTVQLHRAGLLRAADLMDLPRVDLDVRTQAHQATSLTGLTFVAADERWLRQPPRELLHYALLAEARKETKHGTDRKGMQWEYLDLKGRSGAGTWPDAQLRSPEGRDHDVSVEVDTGYPPARCEQKIRAAAEAGYGRIFWATSVHGRVEKVAARLEKWHRSGELGHVRSALVFYVNVHTQDRDPYVKRPRVHKPLFRWVGLTDPSNQ